MAQIGSFTAVYGLFITTAVAIVAGCAGRVPACSTEPRVVYETEAPDLSAPDVTCMTEAEQLLMPVRVFAAPTDSAPEQANLRVGRMIYRCERRDEWISISYPAEGESVDCALRLEQRRCAIGWVRGSLETSGFG